MGGSSETKFLQELVLYAASAALSCLVLFAGLRHLDPNREASKKALEHKKEIAKRLGRPLIQTNPYEVFDSDSLSMVFERLLTVNDCCLGKFGVFFFVCGWVIESCYVGLFRFRYAFAWFSRVCLV